MIVGEKRGDRRYFNNSWPGLILFEFSVYIHVPKMMNFDICETF